MTLEVVSILFLPSSTSPLTELNLVSLLFIPTTRPPDHPTTHPPGKVVELKFQPHLQHITSITTSSKTFITFIGHVCFWDPKFLPKILPKFLLDHKSYDPFWAHFILLTKNIFGPIFFGPKISFWLKICLYLQIFGQILFFGPKSFVPTKFLDP